MAFSWGAVYRVTLAQLELLRARRMLRHRRVGSLVEVLTDEPVPATAELIAKARQWGRAVGFAARYGLGRPTCLTRSLALVRLLDRAGIAGARIKAGVFRDQKTFLAHAWVELGVTVVSDPEAYVAQFEPWADLRVFEDLTA
jgi:hypothetical protein